MNCQRKPFAMVKLYRKLQRNQTSHAGAPAAIKERLNLLKPCLVKCRVIAPLYEFIETILALSLKLFISL